MDRLPESLTARKAKPQEIDALLQFLFMLQFVTLNCSSNKFFIELAARARHTSQRKVCYMLTAHRGATVAIRSSPDHHHLHLRIDIGGLGRTSYAAFAASILLAVKATSEIYPLLHGDTVDGGSIPYVEIFAGVFVSPC